MPPEVRARSGPHAALPIASTGSAERSAAPRAFAPRDQPSSGSSRVSDSRGRPARRPGGGAFERPALAAAQRVADLRQEDLLLRRRRGSGRRGFFLLLQSARGL